MPPNSTPDRQKILKIAGFLLIAALLLGLGFLAGLENDGRLGVSRESDDGPVYEDRINRTLPDDLDYESIERVYDKLRHDFDGRLSEEEILINLKKGLVRATGDPYSEYFSQSEGQRFFSEVRGEFVGVGIYIDIKNNWITIISPIKGSPADRAGLLPGDVIFKIDGVVTHDMSLEEASSRIRGKAGTEVVLGIYRGPEDRGEELLFTVERELISITGVFSEMQGDVCVLTISQFLIGENSTADLSRQAAEDCLRQGAEGVVLDLRFNPGGDLEATRGVAGLWLDSGSVVVQLGRSNEVLQSLEAAGRPILAELPLVVLINEGSASAAEIVAGALDDYRVATFVGQTTFGKTSVQTVSTLSNKEVLKLTTNHWYTPQGRELKDGLEPDVIIEDDPQTEQIDEQLDEALRIIRRQINDQ